MRLCLCSVSPFICVHSGESDTSQWQKKAVEEHWKLCEYVTEDIVGYHGIIDLEIRWYRWKYFSSFDFLLLSWTLEDSLWAAEAY